MPRQIPLIICILFIAWLFYRDRKLRPMTSLALWIPLIWVTIIGTRAVSMWFSDASLQIENINDYLEGSPFDRNVFLGLLVTGLYVLIRRYSQWLDIVKANKLFIIFFVICGLSCLWSDYAFTAFKRYIKDIGNLTMALIILSEVDLKRSVRAVFSRYAYIVIPLSVLFIIYFPEFGRYYNRWTYQPVYCGISTEKNTLGQFAFVCGIFLIWDIVNATKTKAEIKDRLDLWTRFVLLFMVMWLLYMAHSSTSILCMILGSAIVFSMELDSFRYQARNLGIWLVAVLLFVAVVSFIPDLFSSVVELLGRDATMTGRTELWQEILSQPINPLLGSGFQSFWQTAEAARLGEKYYFIPNQAHNGYLEVYIQTGIISLLFLVGALAKFVKEIKKGLMANDPLSKLFFPLFAVLLINNWTEASINKVTLVWFILILSILYRPKLFLFNGNVAGPFYGRAR